MIATVMAASIAFGVAHERSVATRHKDGVMVEVNSCLGRATALVRYPRISSAIQMCLNRLLSDAHPALDTFKSICRALQSCGSGHYFLSSAVQFVISVSGACTGRGLTAG